MTSFSGEKTKEFHITLKEREIERAIRLLSDPEVDINAIDETDRVHRTPFLKACHRGIPEVVRAFLDTERYVDFSRRPNRYGNGDPLETATECYLSLKMLLDDPRIKVTSSPLRAPCINQWRYLGSAEVFLAHDRFDPSFLTENAWSDKARRSKNHRTAELFDNYIQDPAGTKAKLRMKLYPEHAAGELFATVVLLCDNYLELKE